MADKRYIYAPSSPPSGTPAELASWLRREFEAARRGLTSELTLAAGPAGPAGPQGDAGPQGPTGPSGEDASSQIKMFTTPGAYTFTVPTLVYAVRVSLGGGGGSGCLSENSASNNVGSGGNGGDAIIDRLLLVSPGDTITGSVGAGGAAVTGSVVSLDGNAGGATTAVHSIVSLSALGGLGGKQGNTSPGANGGTQTYNGVYVSGGQGVTGANGTAVPNGGAGGARYNVGTTYYVGGGGGSFFGVGLDAGGADALDCEAWDAATHGYGCGGGGYGEGTLEVDDASGAGGDGMVVFIWGGAEYGT